MDDKEFSNVFAIPANYTDSGKILGGMLEPRNAVEALVLIVLVGYPELMLIPMPSTIRIVVMTVTLIPLGVVAMMGIDGDSLFQYLGHIIYYPTCLMCITTICLTSPALTPAVLQNPVIPVLPAPITRQRMLG